MVMVVVVMVVVVVVVVVMIMVTVMIIMTITITITITMTMTITITITMTIIVIFTIIMVRWSPYLYTLVACHRYVVRVHVHVVYEAGEALGVSGSPHVRQVHELGLVLLSKGP